MVLMSDKLLWQEHPSWEKAEKAWDDGAKKSASSFPLKVLKQLPNMPGITEETASHLKWKSLKYLIQHDEKHLILKYFLKHPIKYPFSLLKSYLKKNSYIRDGDFFLYGIKSLDDFKKLLEDENTLLITGFSYCHKPFECPSGRFTVECIRDPDHPVCRQCFIGKSLNALPDKKVVPLLITTIHYIGEKVFETVHKYPDKKVIFFITACEMTLKMFSDWGNMVGVKGVGVRLDGRICNTMKAFELSEKGVKPGLTVVLDETQKKILNLIKHRRDHS